MKQYVQLLGACLFACGICTLREVSAQEFTVTYSGQVTRTWNWSDGTRDRITVNAAGTVVVKPQQISCDDQTFLSHTANLITTNHVWGSAIQDGSVPTDIYNFDVTRLITRTPSTTYSRFTPGTGGYLYFETEDSVPAPPDTLTIYAWEYVANLEVMRMWVALPNPFYYPDASYEHYDFPATHVVTATNTAPSCLIGTVPGVAGAQVSFGNVPQQTDASGVFHYERIPRGTYRLTISKPGYVTLTNLETIPPFAIMHRTYDLEPITPQLVLMDANPQYLNNLLLPAAELDSAAMAVLASGSVARTHATSDGATELLLHCKTPVPGTVTFSYAGPPGGSLISVSRNSGLGPQTTVAINGKHYAFALYVVPEGIGLQQAHATLSATFTPQESPSMNFQTARDLTLCPTPVLMVHGLWGNSYDWFDLKLDLWGSDVPARLVDYEADNANSFAQNANVIRREADKLLGYCRTTLGYAATRVDVVGHSMGGILTRIASNLPDYRSKDNFQKGYIRRVITVDTPHHGAASASFLLHYLAAFTDPGDVKWRMDIIDRFKKYPYRGAVRDLDPHSFARSLGGVSNAATAALRIPSHAISCEATVGGDVDYWWEIFPVVGRFGGISGWRDDLLNSALLLRNPGLIDFSAAFQIERTRLDQPLLNGQTPYLDLWRTVFSGQSSDGTVPVDSQVGKSTKATRLPGVSHVRAPHNPGVRSRIITLLNEPVADNFALSGLPEVTPGDLVAQKGWYGSIPHSASILAASSRQQQRDLDFYFGQPQEGSNVVCGQPVSFTLDGADVQQFSDAEVVLMSNGDVHGTLSFTNPPFSGALVCPSNVLGGAQLIALGRSTNGDFRIASVGLSVQRPPGISLVAMSTDPLSIALDGLGESESLHVSGEFSDLVNRDVTAVAAGTRYSLDNTNLATIDGVGRVTAHAPGVTWIDVVNGALSNRVTLNVTFRPPEILALWPQKLANATPTNLVLNISGLRLGGASALEVLRNGQPAVGLILSNMNLVSASGFLAATLIVGQNAEPGRYTVAVTTPGGRSDAFENKGAQFTIDGPITLEASRGPGHTLNLRVNDALERAFILETAQTLGAWSPAFTNAAVGGTWETNGLPSSSSEMRFFRARLFE